MIAGVIPLLVDWVYKALLHPRPFWAFYYDPETIYIHEGLRLLSARVPVNVDNPGTPVQLLTAAIEFFVGRSPQSIDSIRLCGYVVALIVAIAAAFLLERTLFRETPPLLAIAGLWTFFLAPAALEYDTIWSPEIFYFALGAITLAALSRRKPPIVIGICVGIAIAVKFVFLAFVPALGVAVYVERRRIRHAGLGVLCGFVAGTLPVASRYPEMARWLWRLVTRSGWYGKGPAEAPHLRLTLLGYYELALSCRLWILWSVIVVAIVILARRRDRAVMLFGLVAIATSIAMTARTPAARYILPAALGVVALIGAVRELKPAVSAIVFVVAAALAAEAVIHDVRVHDRLIADQTALRLQIDRTIARIARPNDVITFGWRTPQPSFALRIFARDERWIAETERLYPRIGHVNTWEGRFYLPAGATKWDLLVIERGLWPWIPNGGVRTAADVGPYIIVRPR